MDIFGLILLLGVFLPAAITLWFFAIGIAYLVISDIREGRYK